jgi:hypothetical protein
VGERSRSRPCSPPRRLREIQRREAAASEAAAALPEPLCSFEASLDGAHVADLLARSPLAVVPSATRLLTSPMEEVAEKIAESHTTPVANGIRYTASSLRCEGTGACSQESLPEPREHRQVGVKSDAVDATHAERSESAVVLQAAELPFHGGAPR